MGDTFSAKWTTQPSQNTPDGKRTLHAAAMAIYRRRRCEDETSVLKLPQPPLRSTKKDLPSTCTKLIDCPKPAGKPASPVYTSISLKKNVPLSVNTYLSDIAWLFGRTLFKCLQREAEEQLEEGDELALDLDEQKTAANGNIPS